MRVTFMVKEGLPNRKQVFNDVKQYFWDDPFCSNNVRINDPAVGAPAWKLSSSRKLDTIDPPGDITMQISPLKRSLMPDSFGLQYTKMPTKISSGSTTTRSDYSLPDYEVFYLDDDHIKEKSSGSTTTQSDISLSKCDSFIFDLSNDLFPPTDRSDFYHEEFADELAHIISPPDLECFYFKIEPELSNLTMDVVEDILPIREPIVHVPNVKTKRIHDAKIKNRVFNVGDQVLLFNSRLKIFSGKLKSRWSGPFTIVQVFPYGTVELSQNSGPNFKVNGHRLKHYFGGDIPAMDIPDLQTFPKDN
ncbi:hypothetical protein Tco_0455765 [Tanacetum coccineum]